MYYKINRSCKWYYLRIYKLILPVRQSRPNKKRSTDPGSHLLILLISCLYESPRSDFKFARKILKPKAQYTEAIAHNCIFDVLFIDLLVFFKFYLNKDYSGVTADKAVAVYWSTVIPNVDHVSTGFNLNPELGNGLFEEATDTDLQYIVTELKKL
ncbi:hypothetical protein B0W48_13940 [Pseudoalteromonas aliena]|uniref:Uncharacterized protein n=1 Tax=Pseudoalteromonas aliena TaxID=247523 RepID=A0A1Q2H0E1_9GAMM|nr:hypothetical protein [Pseudoalteromonas aliena]AQQ00815.1 hypothetical protein B0W48_13940 [Pseudoalteromonas aliena]